MRALYYLYLLTALFHIPHILYAQVFTVTQSETGFDPPTIIINSGDAIEFVNARPDAAWVASDLHPSHTAYPGTDVSACEDGVKMFDACGAIAPGESFIFVFNEPGVWGFHDHLHPSFGGQVIVRGESVREWRSALSWYERLHARIFRLLYTLAPEWGDRTVRSYPLRETVRDPKEREYVVRRFGHDRVLAALERPLGDERSPVICHVEGHYVGRVAYELGYVAMTEANLDTRCQFGFYHGLLEVGIGTAGTDEMIVERAKECETRKDDLLFVLSCYHGLGHGLTVYHRYDLPTALEKCRLIPNERAWNLCYHGVFMENSFVARGFGVEHVSQWLRDDDVWFPCFDSRIAGDDSAPICAFSLPTIWSVSKFSPDEQIARCAQLDGKPRSFCFQGFGFNTSAWYIFDDIDMRRMCERVVDVTDRADCLAGAAVMSILIRDQSVDITRSALCAGAQEETVRCASMLVKRLAWALEL